MEDILIPIAFFATVVLIVHLSMKASARQKQLEHEEKMLALEKGVDVPMREEPKPKQRNPYLWPFIFIAIGLAFALKGILQGDFELDISLIPLFIGIGMLLAHYLYSKQQKKVERESPENTTLDQSNASY